MLVFVTGTKMLNQKKHLQIDQFEQKLALFSGNFCWMPGLSVGDDFGITFPKSLSL
jgi:hypothetical protein